MIWDIIKEKMNEKLKGSLSINTPDPIKDANVTENLNKTNKTNKGEADISFWDIIKKKISETFNPSVYGYYNKDLKGYNPVTKTVTEKTRVFDTTNKLHKIKKNVEKDNTVLIYNPISQRTFSKNKETGSYIDGEMKVGNEKTSDEDKVVSLVSTAIQSIKYDPNKQRAYVVFKNGDGTEYTYKVTPEEFDDFLNAASKGRWVAKVWNRNPHFSILKKKKK